MHYISVFMKVQKTAAVAWRTIIIIIIEAARDPWHEVRGVSDHVSPDGGNRFPRS